MDLNLNGQVAVIVGSAMGIGHGIAAAFAQEGAHVALVDLSPDVGEAATRLGVEHGVRTTSVVADVTDLAAMHAAAAKIEADLGSVEHLVYAVGIGSGKTGFPFWNIEPHEWTRVLDVCLMGGLNTIYAFKDSMIEERRGTVLFLASVAGQIGSQTDPPYSAAKAALINFMQVAAKDLAPYDVRVNVINPGMVDTELNRRIHAGSNLTLPPAHQTTFEEWGAAKLEKMVPLKRWQRPEDIAAMAIFLASERAMNITGQTINVDGGFVMHS